MKSYLFHLRNKFMSKYINIYEGWILPPNNVSLFELKKRELKEKTKYLDPKILYTLSEEEKNGKIIMKFTY